MALWLVRAGKYGQDEAMALEEGLAIVGFREIPDISKVSSQEELKAVFEENMDLSKNAISNFNGQLWAFRSRIEKGDLVVLPLKVGSGIAIGEVTDDYKYIDGRHTRKVKWLKTDIPRSDFGQDLLYSFGAFMTVCRIQRNNAEERVRAMLKGAKDINSTISTSSSTGAENFDDNEGSAPVDLESFANDQLRSFIDKRFRGHELTRLVEEILIARGYYTFKAPPGPDGGVDIIAGKGALGFDSPRICVQVKSGGSVDDITVRELEGVMGRMQADRGLFVSWGGFKQSVTRKTSDLFFKVRLWDSANLIEALLEVYDQLPDDIQAELPLKRIWVPVLEDE